MAAVTCTNTEILKNLQLYIFLFPMHIQLMSSKN